MTFREMLSGWKSVEVDDEQTRQTLYFRRKRTMFFYAALYLALLALMRHFLADLPLLFLLACMMFFFALHVLFLFYCAVIGQTRNLLTYRSGGWIAWFLSRRLMLFLVNVVVAMLLSFLCVVRLAAMSPVDFGILGLTLLFLAAMYGPMARRTPAESVPWLIYRRVMGWSLWGVVIVSFLLQMGAAFLGCYDAPAYASIQEALDSRTIAIMTGSNIINWVLDASSYLQTCEMYFLSQLVQGGVVAGLLSAGISVFSFGSVLAAFMPVMIPPSERRRIFIARAIPSTEVPPCDRKSVFWFSVVGTLMFLGAAFLFAGLDSSAGSASAEEKVEALKKTTTEYVVQVDGVLYRSGFYDEVQSLKRDYSDRIAKAQQEVLLSHARMCGAMEANVDRFLDWYYSLGAEYMRIANTLVRNGERYLQEKLEENLYYGIDTAAFKSLLNNLGQLEDEYDYLVAEAGQKFRLTEAPGAGVTVVALDSSFLDLLDRNATIDFKSRMGVSSTLGLAAGAVAAKALSKPAMKVAATTIAKLVAGKLATGAAAGGSVAAGVYLGGAIGSVVPGVGTAVGAGVGGAITGIGAWIAGDAIMVSLEEYVSRDDMRREILEAIGEECGNV